jgi:hypothetical protein
MYALVLFIQLSTPNLPANQFQVSYEVVAKYPTNEACLHAKAVAKLTAKDNRAYECFPVDKE